MAKRDLKSILVRMPTTLKRSLAREVARRDSTINDVAVEILAAEFGVEFTPSGRRVLTATGRDVTVAFDRGADAALTACAAHGIRIAILKDGSPSCGSRSV